MQNKMVYLCALVLLCLISTGCSDTKSKDKNNNSQVKSSSPIISATQMNSSKNIAENIMADSSHTIFVEALDSTDLLETLTKPGPFTVFTPPNSAFRKLPQGTFEGWMKARKKDLTNILSYHIVAGSIKAKDMKDGQKIKTLAGEELIVTLRKHKLLINGIKVTEPDIRASNGVIYVIDELLFPRGQNPGGY